MRTATIQRKTKETNIELKLALEGGDVSVQTGVGFFDHMLTAFACHGHFGLTLCAKGDLEVDQHHTIEDVGLALGQALKEALGDKRGITRFGTSHVPLDESLARVVLDLSGRPHLAWDARFPQDFTGTTPVCLFREFFQAVANSSGTTIHVALLACGESHHGAECIFKAFGRALAEAVALRPGENAVPSTKGVL